MPHTPHTPGAATGTHPLTPGGPPSVSSIYNETNTNANQSSPSQNNLSPQHKSNMNNQQQQHHHHHQQHQQQHNSLIDSLTANSLMQNGGSLVNLTDVDLNADLNFDPAAVIDGENTNDLNVSLRFN